MSANAFHHLSRTGKLAVYLACGYTCYTGLNTLYPPGSYDVHHIPPSFSSQPKHDTVKETSYKAKPKKKSIEDLLLCKPSQKLSPERVKVHLLRIGIEPDVVDKIIEEETKKTNNLDVTKILNQILQDNGGSLKLQTATKDITVQGHSTTINYHRYNDGEPVTYIETSFNGDVISYPSRVSSSEAFSYKMASYFTAAVSTMAAISLHSKVVSKLNVNSAITQFKCRGLVVAPVCILSFLIASPVLYYCYSSHYKPFSSRIYHNSYNQLSLTTYQSSNGEPPKPHSPGEFLILGSMSAAFNGFLAGWLLPKVILLLGI